MKSNCLKLLIVQSTRTMNLTVEVFSESIPSSSKQPTDAESQDEATQTTGVVSVMLYGIIVWGGGYLTPLQPIHLLQRRPVRLIVGVYYLSRTPRLFESFGILTVFDLYKLQLGVLCTIIKDASCLLYLMITVRTSRCFIPNQYKRLYY